MLEIKLVDGSIIKFEKEYIWMDEIYKDLNNISEFIKIDDYIISKDKDLTNLGILTAKLMIKSKKKEDENEKLRRN